MRVLFKVIFLKLVLLLNILFLNVSNADNHNIYETLEIINRCQTHEEEIDAFNRSNNRGLHLGGHLILGLPGETKKDMLDHAKRISDLPINTLKIHHLQI